MPQIGARLTHSNRYRAGSVSAGWELVEMYTVSSPEDARDAAVYHFRKMFDAVETEAAGSLSLNQINRAIEIIVAQAGELMWIAGRESGLRAATQVTIIEDAPFGIVAGRDC